MISETIQAAKDGDVRAFAQIVRQYRQSVFRICVRILGDGDDAEDAVQETFVRAWQAISGYDIRFSIATWLGAIARLRPGSGKRCGRKRPGNAVPESDLGLGSDAEDRFRACRDRGASV